MSFAPAIHILVQVDGKGVRLMMKKIKLLKELIFPVLLQICSLAFRPHKKIHSIYRRRADHYVSIKGTILLHVLLFSFVLRPYYHLSPGSRRQC